MATGIPPKTKTVKRKIPVVVSYDGKVNVVAPFIEAVPPF